MNNNINNNINNNDNLILKKDDIINILNNEDFKKNLEENYKDEDYINDTIYCYNIIIWNTRGLFQRDKLEFLYEKMELYRPIIIFIVDSKKNLKLILL